jgi:hypothetical protein
MRGGVRDGPLVRPVVAIRVRQAPNECTPQRPRREIRQDSVVSFRRCKSLVGKMFDELLVPDVDAECLLVFDECTLATNSTLEALEVVRILLRQRQPQSEFPRLFVPFGYVTIPEQEPSQYALATESIDSKYDSRTGCAGRPIRVRRNPASSFASVHEPKRFSMTFADGLMSSSSYSRRVGDSPSCWRALLRALRHSASLYCLVTGALLAQQRIKFSQWK